MESRLSKWKEGAVDKQSQKKGNATIPSGDRVVLSKGREVQLNVCGLQKVEADVLAHHAIIPRRYLQVDRIVAICKKYGD